jgi:hypothetical protein
MTKPIVAGGHVMPEPSCPHGYTRSDLEAILGSDYDAFGRWMCGQTMMICEATTYHHDRKHGEFCGHVEGDEETWQCDYVGTGYYEPSECAETPHGVVVYRCDLRRFMLGLPVLD